MPKSRERLYFFGNWAPAKQRVTDPSKKISTYYGPEEMDIIVDAASKLRKSENKFLSTTVDHVHDIATAPGRVLALYRTRDNDLGCIGTVENPRVAKNLWKRIDQNRNRGLPDIGLSPFIGTNLKIDPVHKKVVGVDSRDIFHVSLVDDPDHGDFGTWVKFTSDDFNETVNRFNDYRRTDVAYMPDADVAGFNLFRRRAAMVPANSADAPSVMYYELHSKNAYEEEMAIDAATPLCEALLEAAPARPLSYAQRDLVASAVDYPATSAALFGLRVHSQPIEPIAAVAAAAPEVVPDQIDGGSTNKSDAAVETTDSVVDMPCTTEADTPQAVSQSVEMADAITPPPAGSTQQPPASQQPPPNARDPATEAAKLAAHMESLRTTAATSVLPSDIDPDGGGRQASSFKRSADADAPASVNKVAAVVPSQQQQQQSAQAPTPAAAQSALEQQQAAQQAAEFRIKAEEYEAVKKQLSEMDELKRRLQEAQNEINAAKAAAEAAAAEEQRKKDEAEIQRRKELLKNLRATGYDDSVLKPMETLLSDMGQAGQASFQLAEGLRVAVPSMASRHNQHVASWSSTEKLVDAAISENARAVEQKMPPLVSFSFNMTPNPAAQSSVQPAAPQQQQQQQQPSAQQGQQQPQIFQLSAAASRGGMAGGYGAGIGSWRSEYEQQHGAQANVPDPARIYEKEMNDILCNSLIPSLNKLNYTALSKQRDERMRSWSPDDYADLLGMSGATRQMHKAYEAVHAPAPTRYY